MPTIQFFERLVKLLRKTIEKLSELDRNDVVFWLDICSSTITELSNSITNVTLSRAEKQKFQTCMTHLSCMQVEFEQHMKLGAGLQEPDLEGIETRVQWQDVKSAFENRIKTGVIVNIKHIDILSFLKDAEEVFKTQMKKFLEQHNSAKVNSDFISEFILPKSVEEEKKDIKYFSTESEVIYKTTDLDAWFRVNIKEPILKWLEDFQESESGWTLKSLISLCINMKKFVPIRANSYVPLPASVYNKKACVNVCNWHDNECFKWSILAALHPQKKNAHRINKYYPYENELSFAGIDFPVKLSQIKKFEVLNDISVNVYILQKHKAQFKISPCHLTSSKKKTHVNLLLIQDKYADISEEEIDESMVESMPKYHYVLIKNLSRLLNKQVSKRGYKGYYCERCLHLFYSEEKLLTHEVDCSRINKCRIDLPSAGNNILKFKDHMKNEEVPFVIYADFECMLKKTGEEKAFQLHEAYSIGFYKKCSFDDDKSEYKVYRRQTSNGKTPAEWFIAELKTIADEVEAIYEKFVPMRLTDLEQLSFHKATKCHICQVYFKENDIKVRDHCHLTGRYRGAAHNNCNLNYINSRYIPIFFHNLKYDANFILKEIATSSVLKGEVTVIPENKEKYISFTKHIKGKHINFRFLDTYRFLTASLEELASYIEKMPTLEKIFQKDGYFSEQIDLLKRKGIFPYDLVSDLDKLSLQQLPSRDEFYNQLTDSHISTDDYLHATNVWNEFKIKSLGEYSDLYLKTDVLLLTEVFESFRRTCREAYGLDPAHFYNDTWFDLVSNVEVNAG